MQEFLSDRPALQDGNLELHKGIKIAINDKYVGIYKGESHV